MPSVASDPPFVSVVVLNWNGYADTAECLRRLLESPYPSFEVHVVDNASKGDDADKLEAEFGDRVRLTRNRENTGFTGGNNVAMQAVLSEKRAKYIALLNNDTVPDDDWLPALVDKAEREPEAGMFASRMVFADEPDRIENTGVVLVDSFDAVPRGRGRPASDFRDDAEIVGACGGAVLYRAEMLVGVGVFREDFFANFEDVELSLRAQAHGWSCHYVAGAIVQHKLSRSIDKVRNEDFNVRSQRNAAFACLVNLPWQVIALNLPFLAIRDLGVFVLGPLMLQWPLVRTVARARWRLLCERKDILRCRRELAPYRKPGWFTLWRRQGNLVPLAFRYFVDVVLLRKRRFLE